MISTYRLKTSFQNLLRPISRALLASKITPNAVTSFTVVLSVAYAVALARFHAESLFFLTVPPFLFVRMALNAIDGMMAREAKLESPQGVFLNELGDIVCDLALFFAFCATESVRLESMVVFSVLAMLSEMAGLVGVQIGVRRGYEGPMGKSDRAVLASILAIVYFAGIRDIKVYDGILALGSLALVLTIFNRVRSALLASSQSATGKVKSE